MMNRWLKSFLLLIWFMSSGVFGNETLKGAACFIIDQSGYMVTTTDFLTRKISIPGGGLGQDTPIDAAIRETFEETGIHVTVIKEIFRNENVVIFDCKANQFIEYTYDQKGMKKVAAWHAPHLFKEVVDVHLRRIEEIPLHQSRFPDQVSQFSDWLKQSTPSESLQIPDTSQFFDPKDALMVQADLNRQLQLWIGDLPSHIGEGIHAILFALSWLGHGMALVALIPIALVTGGAQRWLQVMAAFVLVGYSVAMLKLYFAVPRPEYFLPETTFVDTMGYAFPSGFVTTAFVIFGLLYFWYGTTKKHFMLIWLLPGISVALGRVYLGANFILDTLFGAILGGSIALCLNWMRKKGWLNSSFIWLLFSVVNFISGWYQIQVNFLYLGICCFTMFLLQCFYRLPKTINKHSDLQKFRLLVMSSIALGLTAIGLHLVVEYSRSIQVVITLHSVIFFLMMLLLHWCARKSVRMS